VEEGPDREVGTHCRKLMVWCFGRMMFPKKAGWMGTNKEEDALEGAEIATETLFGRMPTVELYFERRGWARL